MPDLKELGRHLFSVSGQERAVYFRSLATMFRAGINLDRCLDLLGQQSQGELGRASRAMSTLILSGHYFSQAMVKFPWVFTPLQRRLVQVGERSGALGEVLERLSLYEEHQVGMHLKVRSALTLPAFICMACIAMVVFLPPLLFRGIFQMLADSHMPIPFVTQVVMRASDLFRSPLFYVSLILAAGGAVGLWWRMQHNAPLRLRFARLMLASGILGKTARMIAVTRFARSLQTMLSVGVPLLAALELASRATDNAAYEHDMEGVVARVKEGEPLHEALQQTGLFPVSFVQGVQVGSESGSLEAMLGSLCRLYDSELDYMFEVLAAAAEPLILLFVGCVVGFVVIATLLPMVRLLQTL